MGGMVEIKYVAPVEVEPEVNTEVVDATEEAAPEVGVTLVPSEPAEEEAEEAGE